MPILNYTTKVEAAKTVSEITAILQYHHAKSILTEYDTDGQVIALSFTVLVNGAEIPIRLPVEPEAIFRIITKQFQESRHRTKRPDRTQAIRIAWRIVKDWVEAQMALYETQMVKMEQIFLPYVVTPSGKTVYEIAASNGFLQIPQKGTPEIKEG